MPHNHNRVEFAPPAQPVSLRAFALAILAHLLLLGALTWGVNWKSQSTPVTAEAELWASVPQQAAPRAAEPVAPPPEPIPPKVKPAPAPVVEEKTAPQPREADITAERDKQRKKQLDKELEEEKQEKLQNDRLKKAADKKAQDATQKKSADEAKKEAQRKVAEDNKLAAAKAAQEEQQTAQQREANLKRITGMAGASGDASATGSAQQSSGPSSGYGGRIRAKVRPNLVFTSTVSGNPKVTIEVKMAPDGTILGRPRVIKSSGNSEWDEAVVRAFEKTEVLPRDIDGRVHSPLEVDWRVND
jgi:colicin import membrane protein